ncbi:MAG TPA: hypothetical protein PKZ76_00355 [Xanthomonadaceae bacterium]|nr:hypothetical protein [Xanthomonadaceae bacterium]
MRALVAATLAGLLACAASAHARDADSPEQPSRFAMREARVEPEATVADDRYRLRAQFVRYGGAAEMEALGLRLQSQLVAKGSGCTVPAAIFADGFE